MMQNSESRKRNESPAPLCVDAACPGGACGDSYHPAPVADLAAIRALADEALRVAARNMLNGQTAYAVGKGNPSKQASAWDKFALALDAAENAALDTIPAPTESFPCCSHCPPEGCNYRHGCSCQHGCHTIPAPTEPVGECHASEPSRADCQRMADDLPHIACPCGRASGKPTEPTGEREALVARVEAVIAPWVTERPQNDQAVEMNYRVEMIRAALSPTPHDGQPVTETFFRDKETGEPCPRRGNVLCTLPYDSEHRHVHRPTPHDGTEVQS